MPDMVIRAYQKGDENKILELFQSVYPEQRYDEEHWLKLWHWKYEANPIGPPLLWIAESGTKLAGQYAIIPIKIKIKDGIYICYQSVDTMTHPNYRHQGIFEALANKTYKEAAKNGTFCVFGFPNKNSYSGFIRKLGWFGINRMEVIIKPLNWENTINTEITNKYLSRFLTACALTLGKIFYRTKRFDGTSGLIITRVSSFDERIDALWEKLSNQFPILIVRNKEYLNWRYVTIPDVNYSIFIAEIDSEILGYLILRCLPVKQIKVGIIFDIFAQTREVIRCLVSKAVEECKQENVDIVYYRMIADKTYSRALRDNGFMSIPFVKDTWFAGYSSALDTSNKFLKDSRNWLIQLGDSDMI